MDYPRGIYRFALAVKDIKNNTTDKKGKNNQCGQAYRIPADHHCNMIQSKSDSAEDARPLFSYFVRKTDKSEAAKDEFLKAGVAHGDIESDKDKIILCNTNFIEGRSNTGEIEIFAEQEVCADDKGIHYHAKCEHRKKRFLVRLKKAEHCRFFADNNK